MDISSSGLFFTSPCTNRWFNQNPDILLTMAFTEQFKMPVIPLSLKTKNSGIYSWVKILNT
jgi:hypothetical protein